MYIPAGYKYSKEHTWVKTDGQDSATVGITEFAQSELGEIVYVDLPKVGSVYKKDEIFGSVEAVKTTSDLYMPVGGEITELNDALKDDPTLVNFESFTGGWMVKIKVLDPTEIEGLFTAAGYESIVS